MESTGPSVVDKIMFLCVHRQLKKEYWFEDEKRPILVCRGLSNPNIYVNQ